MLSIVGKQINGEEGNLDLMMSILTSFCLILLMQKLSFSLMEKAFDSTFMNGGRRGAATAAMANGNDCSGWFDGRWILLWLGLGED